MRWAAFTHILLVVGLFAGYTSALRLARRSVGAAGNLSKPGRIGLWSAYFMMCWMPLCGLFVLSTPLENFLPALVGAPFNLAMFYGACTIFWRDRIGNSQAR